MLERTSERIARGEAVNVISYGDSISTVKPGYFGGASCAQMNWAHHLQPLHAPNYTRAPFFATPFGVGRQKPNERLGRF